MLHEILGCGLACFGQFQLTGIYCSASSNAPVSVFTTDGPDSCFVTQHKMVGITGLTESSQVNVQASLIWDASFIRLQATDWTMCLASHKWARHLKQVKEDILQVWEFNDHSGTLLIKCDRKSTLMLHTTGTAVGTLIPFCEDIDNYCSLTGGDSYVLSSNGSLCQFVFHPSLPTLTPIFPAHTVTHLANGTDHVLIVTENGFVYSFGLGTRGQLGHGDLTSRGDPCMIEALAGINVTAVSCGNWHSMALTVHGDIYSWGMNSDRQLGHSTNTSISPLPALVDIAGDDVSFTSIDCGARHSAGLSDTNNTLYVWGWDKYRQSFNEKIPFVKYFKCGPWCTVFMK